VGKGPGPDITTLARLDEADLRWQNDAACAGHDPDIFFPANAPGVSIHAEIAQAKAICATCTVTEQCLDYALATHQEHGIWGGLNERERRRIRRRQRQAARP